MILWILAFAASTTFAAVGFVVIAVLWLRRLRETVSSTLGETISQQVRTAQRLSETIGQLQNQQRVYEQHLHNMAQANVRLKQDIAAVATRIELGEHDAVNHSSRTLH